MVGISHFCPNIPLEIGSFETQVGLRIWLLEDHFVRAVKKNDLPAGNSEGKKFVKSHTFLACLQSQPLTCSKADTVSGASQNFVIGPPEFFGWTDAIFVFIDSGFTVELRVDCSCTASQLSTQTSKQNQKLSLSLVGEIKI